MILYSIEIEKITPQRLLQEDRRIRDAYFRQLRLLRKEVDYSIQISRRLSNDKQLLISSIGEPSERPKINNQLD